MSIIAFVRDSPLASAELHLILDRVSFGDLSMSHGVLCRYMPTSLFPIHAASAASKHTAIYPPCPEQGGAGTDYGDALMCLSLLRHSSINQPTILDAWIAMAVSSLPTTSSQITDEPPSIKWSSTSTASSHNNNKKDHCPILLVTDAGHCKAVERFGAARRIPMDNILCTGRATLLPLNNPPPQSASKTSPTPKVVLGREGHGVTTFLTDLGMVLRERRSLLKEPVMVICPSLVGTTSGNFPQYSNTLLPPSLVGALKSGVIGTEGGSSTRLDPPYAILAADDNTNPLSPLMLSLTFEAVDRILEYIKNTNLLESSSPPLSPLPDICEQHDPPVVVPELMHLSCANGLSSEEAMAVYHIRKCMTESGVFCHSIKDVIPRTACMSKVQLQDYMCAVGFSELCVACTDLRYESVVSKIVSVVLRTCDTTRRNHTLMTLFRAPPPVPPQSQPSSTWGRISHRSYARVGLMGNPSDQLHGKSIAVTIKNFWAEAHIIGGVASPLEYNTHNTPGNVLPHLTLIPNPIFDQFNFSDLSNLSENISSEGYSGGMRLMQATCKRFFEYCTTSAHSSLAAAIHSLDGGCGVGGFSLTYHTNIPRQVGLAGSSAIIVSILKCLLELYGIEIISSGSSPTANTASPTQPTMTYADLASLALSVEVLELGIHAGLMDRVSQVYEGLVAMDFSKEVMAAETTQASSALDAGDNDSPKMGGGALQRGRYERLPLSLLPTTGILLAYARDPSDSGKIHANVKERWMRGDAEVVEAAKTWAGFVDEALDVLRSQSSPSQFLPERFCQLVDDNFDLRFKIYGKECLGWKNVRMIEIARAHNAAGKFCGSGGAIIVLPRPTTDTKALQEAMGAEGFVLVPLIPI